MSGATSFLGPGRYNDQENFNKLVQQPCSSVMKKISAVPSSESGKPSYIMVGHSMQFEPAFLETMRQRREMRKLNITGDCTASLHSSLNTHSISKIKQKIIDLGINNAGDSRDQKANESLLSRPSARNPSANQYSFDKNASKTPVDFYSSRPGTATVKTSKTPAPMGQYVQRINTSKKGGVRNKFLIQSRMKSDRFLKHLPSTSRRL